MVIGMVEAATSATRIGMSNSTTMMTATTAITSSRRKLTTESFTTFGWSVIRNSLTLGGSVGSNASSTL